MVQCFVGPEQHQRTTWPPTAKPLAWVTPTPVAAPGYWMMQGQPGGDPIEAPRFDALMDRDDALTFVAARQRATIAQDRASVNAFGVRHRSRIWGRERGIVSMPPSRGSVQGTLVGNPDPGKAISGSGQMGGLTTSAIRAATTSFLRCQPRRRPAFTTPSLNASRGF